MNKKFSDPTLATETRHKKVPKKFKFCFPPFSPLQLDTFVMAAMPFPCNGILLIQMV